MHQTPLLDRCQRRITYLRLSLTEACAMRCVYCRPRRHGVAADRPMLNVHEIGRLVEHLAACHGLRKVRLTGGDPTSRPDLTAIIERLASVPGIEDLAMTTHGLTLAGHAAEYARAGLRRVNVSLDTLDPDRFEKMTGVDGLTKVLAGLDAAESARLGPIRINTVVVRGQNDGDLVDLVRWSARRCWDIRFIELMPMGPLAAQWSERYVPEAEMRRRLDSVVRRWEPIDQGHDAARRYRVTLEDGSTTTLGFITPMSCNFCAACNRIRIAGDGTLYPCLMDRPGPSLLPALRPCFDARALDRLLEEGLAKKQPEHPAQGHAMMVQLGG
ncbi:MAG: GTP 3',8-cyclase MoaA [Phycisphaeraceae bacterium]|nr:GTP 3',8-cyclase MoaA [Phycisphaeraceae bacterium]